MAIALTQDGVERPGPNAAPTAFRIWSAGANATDMGRHVFSETSAALLMSTQAKRGNKFSIDVDHLSLNDTAPPESRKAVGWHRLAVRQSVNGPELWAVDVEWTDAVKAGLEKNPPEWRYFSPAYHIAKDGEIDQYINTALTNNPATHDVTALASMVRTSMDYKEMASALFGEDDDKKKAAKESYTKMSELEKKAFKAAWKAASDFGDSDGDVDKKDEPKKEEATKAAASEDDKKKEEAAIAATKASEDAKKEEAKVAAAASARELTLAARVQSLESAAAARAAADAAAADVREREAIFAKRPDISQAIRATLATLPLDGLRKFVEAMPRVQAAGGSSVQASLAGGAVTGGERRAAFVPQLDDDERKIFANIRPASRGAVRATSRGTSLVMPSTTPTRAEALARVAELDKELEAIQAERV